MRISSSVMLRSLNCDIQLNCFAAVSNVRLICSSSLFGMPVDGAGLSARSLSKARRDDSRTFQAVGRQRETVARAVNADKHVAFLDLSQTHEQRRSIG
jgi:hypothetical protein